MRTITFLHRSTRLNLDLLFPVDSLSALADLIHERLGLPTYAELRYLDPPSSQFIPLRNIALLNQIREIDTLLVLDHAPYWWNWQIEGNSRWVEREHPRIKDHSYFSLLLKDGTSIIDSLAFERLEIICKGLNFDISLIKKASAVCSPTLLKNFESQLEIFRKAFEVEDPPEHQALRQLSQIASLFWWNDGTQVSLIL